MTNTLKAKISITDENGQVYEGEIELSKSGIVKGIKIKPNTPNDIDDKMKKLADLCGLNLDEIKDVISVRDEKIDLLITPQGSLSERQSIASQCILVSHHVVLDREWVNSKTLAEALKESGINDPGNNLAVNLKKSPEIFRTRKNAQILDYKLTIGTGRSSAYEVLKKLAKGENQ